MNTLNTSEQIVKNLEPWIGVESAPSPWLTVRQEDVNAFADVTRDHNFLHVDPELAAKESPYKTTIAHGFFTISLMSYLVRQIPSPEPSPYEGVINSINYGFDRFRLVAPVKVGAQIRARRSLVVVRIKRPGMIQVSNDVTIDIQGEDKPACVARWLTLLLCDP